MVVFAGPPPPDRQPPVPGEGGGSNTGGQVTGVAIQRLPAPTAVGIVPGQSFSDLVAQQLGNFGTESDGFDVLFNAPASRFRTDVPALSIFDATLSAADALGPTFDTGGFADIGQLLNSLVGVGDSFFGTPAPGVQQATAKVGTTKQAAQTARTNAAAGFPHPPDKQPAPKSA